MSVVERLYEGFEKGDAKLMAETLHPEFVLQVSEGMPLGVGGKHVGQQAAMRDVWGAIFAAYDTRPVPAEYLWSGPERCVVLGHYSGTARATGQPFEAAFAHVIALRDGLIVELVQITDTASWAR